MKKTLFALVAAAVIAPTMAFADATVTTSYENTNDGYYINRPTTDVSKTAIIRDDNYDVRGNRVVRDEQVETIVPGPTTVTKSVAHLKYGSDSGFGANMPRPQNSLVTSTETTQTVR